MSKITIIVPIYNMEKYIKKCIDSLIEQTYKDFEILAISDGSSDDSVNILNNYNDNRLTIVQKENGGYGSVLELAISIIKTPYFLICDPDDWLEKNAIEEFYKIISVVDCDLVVGNFYLQTDNSSKKAKSFSKQYEVDEKKINHLIDKFAFASWSPHSKLYKTILAKNISFPKKVKFTDEILYLVFLTKCKSLIYLDEYLSNYYFERAGNSNSELKSYSIRTFKQQLIVYDYIKNQIDFSNKNNYPIIARLFETLINMKNNIKYIDEDKSECYLKINNRMSKYKNINFIKYYRSTNIFKTLVKRIYIFMLWRCVYD